MASADTRSGTHSLNVAGAASGTPDPYLVGSASGGGTADTFAGGSATGFNYLTSAGGQGSGSAKGSTNSVFDL
jgi:hypothetical protein